MKTLYLKVDAQNPDRGTILQAARILSGGGLVAFPTETVYGLGANALDKEAVANIFRVKKRPGNNPLTVHVAGIEDVLGVVEELAGDARELMKRFWPGPLTLVLPGGEASMVSAGRKSVAVRMPDHPVALALIRECGVPVVAPSANTSGRPSPTTAQHVLSDLDGCIDAVLDGGATSLGVESTVLDLSGRRAGILRPGSVTPEQLAAVLGYAPEGKEGEAPGAGYQHYTPSLPVYLVEGEPERVAAKVQEVALALEKQGVKVGVIGSHEWSSTYPGQVYAYGPAGDAQGLSMSLYGFLRAMEKDRLDVIVVEGLPAKGVGLAVMDRLRRAAGQNIIRV